MNYTDEEIARAAGLDVRRDDDAMMVAIMRDGTWYDWLPNFYRDPGAVVVYLLPVLEKRMPAQLSFTSFRDSSYEKWCAQGVSGNGNDLSCVYAPTWHECVIEAIMATREDKA